MLIITSAMPMGFPPWLSRMQTDHHLIVWYSSHSGEMKQLDVDVSPPANIMTFTVKCETKFGHDRPTNTGVDSKRTNGQTNPNYSMINTYLHGFWQYIWQSPGMGNTFNVPLLPVRLYDHKWDKTKQSLNIPILPEAFLTFASKSSIGPSCAAHGPCTPCTLGLGAMKWQLTD